jgi:hypothetical protein
MKFYFLPMGRFGNALFRLMAMLVLKKKYPQAELDFNKKMGFLINEETLLKLYYQNQNLNPNTEFLFYRYYQLEDIYQENLPEIKEFLYKNPNLILSSHEDHLYKLGDFFNDKKYPEYDFVLHLRLEDFVENNQYIRINKIIDLLNSIPKNEFNKNAIIVNQVKSSFENQYLNQILQWFFNQQLNIIVESNEIHQDFNLIKNAKIVVCSTSTLSWGAVLLSDKIEKCYFPDYKINSTQTLKKPIKNTILYSINEI